MNWFIEDLFNVIISFATDTYSMMMAAVYSFGQIQAGSHPDVTVVEAVILVYIVSYIVSSLHLVS